MLQSELVSKMICGSCGESLEATKCFQCSSCGSLLDNAMPFAQRNGKYLHLKCYELLDLKCAGCGNSVGLEGCVRLADERRYHNACFVCEHCRQALGTSYASRDGHVYHSQCVCCKDSIVSSEVYLELKGRKYHRNCLRCFVCDTELHSKPFKPTGDNYTCVDCIGVASIAATTNQPSHLTRSALVSKTGTSPSHRKTNENITPQPHTRDDPAAPSNLPSTPASTTSSPIDCTTDAPSGNLDTSANRDSKNNPSPLETFNCNHAAPSTSNSSLSSPRFISASATASDRNEADVLEASCDRLSPSSKSNINHSISDFSISLKDPPVPPRSTPSSPPPPPPQPLSKAPPKRLSVLPFSLLNQIKSGNPLTLLRKPPPSTSFNNESENSIKTALSAALQKMRMFTETLDEDDDY